MVPRWELGIYRVAIRISTGPRLFSHIDVSLPCTLLHWWSWPCGWRPIQLTTDCVERSFWEEFKFNSTLAYHFGKAGTHINWTSDQYQTKVTFKLKCKLFAMRHLSLWLLFLLMYIETKEVTAITWRIVGKNYNHSEPCFSLHDTYSINELFDFGARYIKYKVLHV